MYYRTTLVDTKDGRGTFCLVDIMDKTWRSVGTSRTYWTVSRRVRARSHGETIARRHHKAHQAQLPLTIVKE